MCSDRVSREILSRILDNGIEVSTKALVNQGVETHSFRSLNDIDQFISSRRVRRIFKRLFRLVKLHKLRDFSRIISEIIKLRRFTIKF